MDKTLKGVFILKPNETPKKESKHQSEAPAKHAVHHNSPHFYSAFTDHPINVAFQEQEEGEEIVLLVRRHFVTNVPWIALAILLAILPVFLPFAAATFPFPDLSSSTVFLLLTFYYLFIFGFVLLNFTLWYFHIGLVTTIRLVDIDLAGILYRQITATKHENVEDVTYTQIGFITSLFNFGTVHIQTAGNMLNFEFEQVPQPARVADVISDFARPV